jgi:hypothetical protein
VRRNGTLLPRLGKKMVRCTTAGKLAAFLFFCVAIPADASSADKDILRDACSAIKQTSKRAQCFDALDRITVTQPVPAAPPPEPEKPMMLNTRAMTQCQPFEFAELDSLSKGDAVALYCSYDQGFRNWLKDGKAQTNLATQRAMLYTAERCINAQTKVTDLLHRKFPTETADCSKVIGYKKDAQ